MKTRIILAAVAALALSGCARAPVHPLYDPALTQEDKEIVSDLMTERERLMFVMDAADRRANAQAWSAAAGALLNQAFRPVYQPPIYRGPVNCNTRTDTLGGLTGFTCY